MAGKLTQNDKYALDNFLLDVQRTITLPITPELLKDGIERIREASANGNQVVTHKSLVGYLANNIDTSTLNMDRVEADCNMVAIHTHIAKPKEVMAKENNLVSLSDSATASMGVAKEISESLKSPSARKELRDKFATIALRITGENIHIPESYKKETAEFITHKIPAIGDAAVQNIENMLNANPDIKNALQQLPDMSELNITADHVCQALTKPHTSKNMQNTKVTR